MRTTITYDSCTDAMTWTLPIWLAQALFDLCVWVLLAWLFITGRYHGRH